MGLPTQVVVLLSEVKQDKITLYNDISINTHFLEHTEIRDGPEDYEVQAKTPATFRCNPKHDNNLKLDIIWLNNGQEIEFEGERFVKSSDYSLTITKTNELDSGTYTCVARTRLDQAEASATLIVQGISLPKYF